jgi:hypothetical protein
LNINDVFGNGEHLTAADLKNKKHKLQIAGVTKKDFDNGSKLIVSFHGKEKTLAVNKTNARLIAAAYGPDTDEWMDKEIILYPTKVTYKDQLVDAIRVEIPLKDVDKDEDIPF